VLVLNGNGGLNGTLPASLGDASRLTFLGLGWNDFVGTVPETILQLTSLGVFATFL
jgi:hypothetical protein